MKISAIGIKQIFYGEVIREVAVKYDETNKDNATGLSATELKAFLKKATTKQDKNVHQDTWSFEESEASRTPYKNQLSKKVYRQSTEPGDTTMKFSIGQYDFETRADFKGGVATTDKYSAPSTFTENYKTIVGLTEDNVYIVFTKAQIDANDASTDGAIAISVTATPMEPDIEIESIAWISKKAIDDAPE
jgi:hypothetical protein